VESEEDGGKGEGVPAELPSNKTMWKHTRRDNILYRTLKRHLGRCMQAPSYDPVYRIRVVCLDRDFESLK